jgi:hypothetical protein
VVPRRGYLLLKGSADRAPVRRTVIEEPLGTVDRRLRQR